MAVRGVRIGAAPVEGKLGGEQDDGPPRRPHGHRTDSGVRHGCEGASIRRMEVKLMSLAQFNRQLVPVVYVRQFCGVRFGYVWR